MSEVIHNSRHLWWNMLWQSLGAFFFMTCMLFFLNATVTSTILWAVGAGSMASSAFITFAKPHTSAASSTRIVGGYLVGITTGEVMRLIEVQFNFFQQHLFGTPNFHAVAILAALAVALSIVFMVLLHVEHPPAAGMALVLVLDIKDYYTLAVIFAGAVLLAVLKRIFSPYMKNLI